MVEIDVQYGGGLRCTATHGPSGATLHTDAPADNHGKGESFSPTDLVATALASCIGTILGIQAEKHGWDLAGMTLHVSKTMATEGTRRIARLPVDVHMPVDLSADDRTRAERAAGTCPVHKSLHPDIDAPITFHYPGD